MTGEHKMRRAQHAHGDQVENGLRLAAHLPGTIHAAMAQEILTLRARVQAAEGVLSALSTEGLTDVCLNICLTFGHQRYGIECTAVVGHDHDATVINQPDGPTAIVNAVREALDAARGAG